MSNATCKNCVSFNWKLSASKNWGECLNETVQNSIRLSLRHVNISKPDMDEVQKYTRIHFDEDLFGCRFFEAVLDE